MSLKQLQNLINLTILQDHHLDVKLKLQVSRKHNLSLQPQNQWVKNGPKYSLNGMLSMMTQWKLFQQHYPLQLQQLEIIQLQKLNQLMLDHLCLRVLNIIVIQISRPQLNLLQKQVLFQNSKAQIPVFNKFLILQSWEIPCHLK